MKYLFDKINLVFSAHRYSVQLRSTQYNHNKIKAQQERKLRELLLFCYREVKYYQELFRSINVNPDNIQGLHDLIKIPILTKEHVRERFWDFLPKELPSCRVHRTSGSSGVPVCILSDDNSRIYNSAAIIRYRRAYGMKNSATPILTPLKKETDQSRKPHWTYVQGFHKTFYVNPYTENRDEIDCGVNTLEKLKAPAIIGITPAIKALAYRIKDGVFPSISTTAVLTVGESLSPEVRDLLEDTFKVKVNDTYACSEAGDVAWQCPQSSLYHINAENCILEILNDKDEPAKEGEVGEVVITNLNRFSMPIIRYKNGDLARASYQQCPCGRKLSVIKEIIGRSGEDMHFPNGSTVPWNVLKSVMNHNQIRQFQLVQNSNASVTVKYIPERQAVTSELEALLHQRFKPLLPDSTQVAYEIVNKISQSTSGKSKLVVCNYRGRGNL